MAVEVELILKEIIKPSCPTPLGRKTMTLSFLDESFPAIHVPGILIYARDESTKTALDGFITDLKTSLSETLTRFYPLAGRFENEYTVSCNDQGIPFFVTRVGCTLGDYLNSPRKLELLTKFLPPSDIASLGQRPISEVVPIAIQVNFYEYGGVAIGCYSNHKLIDATSMSTFLNHWAARASKRYNDLVDPDFATIIEMFPPLTEEQRVISRGADNSDDATAQKSVGLSQHVNVPIKVVARSFTFNNNVIKELKAIAASDSVPNPTSFEAVAGFVWKHAMDAVRSNNNDNITPMPNPTVLSFSASLRPRANPPLPGQCMGNLTANVHARLHEATDGDYELKEIVGEIHAGVGSVNQTLARLQGQNGGVEFVAERNDDFRGSIKHKETKFTVFALCKIGFNKVDFGFSRPVKVIPLGIIYPFLRNTMMMVDYSDSHGDGIQVYVCLEEHQMPFLEANQQFLAFAAPDN